MKKGILTTSLFLILVSLGMISCKKEVLSTNEDLNEQDELVYANTIFNFASEENFSDQIKKMMSLSTDKKTEWNRANNFKSFAEVSEEFYFSIDWEQFKTKEEIVKFIDQHSDYLQLRDRDGDIYVEPRLIDNPERYLINGNRMYQIGQLVYKVLDDCKISTPIDDISKMKDINNAKDYLNSEYQKDITIFNYKGMQKTVLHNNEICDIYDEQVDRANNGRNRTYAAIRIVCVRGNQDNPNRMYNSRTYIEFVVRPYMRTLGIYYFCNRTIQADLKLAMTYDPAEPKRYFRFRHDAMASVYEGRYGYSDGKNIFANPVFDAIDIIVGTPSTPPVKFTRDAYKLTRVKFEEY